MSNDPYIITLDNFLSDEDIIMVLNHGKDYDVSQDAGQRLADGTFKAVKSFEYSNIFCLP